MKVNLGCGYDKLRGYLNIDIDRSCIPNVVADFRNLKFRDLDEVRASHLLEHFDRFESIKILKQWYKWLKVDGKLVLEVPDFEEICKEFVKGNQYWLSRHAFGSHKADWAFHKEGWWKSKFEEVLPRIGFEIIEIKKERRIYKTSTASPDKTIYKKFQLPNNEKEVILPNLIVYATKR